LRNFFIIVAFVSAAIALFLSFQDAAMYEQKVGEEVTTRVGATDTAADGGACGFAIMSGLCLIAAAIVAVGKPKVE